MPGLFITFGFDDHSFMEKDMIKVVLYDKDAYSKIGNSPIASPQTWDFPYSQRFVIYQSIDGNGSQKVWKGLALDAKHCN